MTAPAMRPGVARCLGLVVLLATATASAQPTLRAAVSADLRSLLMDVCFDDTPPRQLRAGDAAAARYLEHVRWTNLKQAQTPTVRGARMALGAVPPGSCLNYAVDIGRAADASALGRSGWHGRDILITPELWLWTPGGVFELHVSLPPGLSISAPWPPLANANGFRVGTAPISWAAQVAIGRLDVQTLTIGGETLHAAIVNPAAFDQRPALGAWLHASAEALTSVYGHFPRAHTQILVVPAEPAAQAVPWGQVLRGGAPAVHFVVDRTADLARLQANWTAFHEFSHLLLPFVRRADAFVSEGFASYWQNVIRGRSANLSEEAAWTQLYRGYQRGVAGARGESLRAASRNMARKRSFMRVYWSGAALALMADVALRSQEPPAPGLDALLAQLRECCLDGTRSWSAKELFARLDALGDTAVFSELLHTYQDATEFPDVFPLLQQLGVAEVNGVIVVRDDAPLADVRRAIMKPLPHAR